MLDGHFGLEIMILHPMVQCVGREPCRYDVHPIIKWLSKYLPIDPWIDGEKPLFEDININKACRMGRTLFVGQNVWDEMQKLKKQNFIY